ncbi:hypothetical protein [Polymorphobacter fuscus]|uniref:Uncharacterized protein n=1 Tax=Sandarakinorhabdus fusca TaxID=1439888 RepID=A0A7C9KYN8_9SPHN|nr:hypothetical protein [Polymorphobacter fuscus]KAB7644157.1 hypothetical protein F9290_14925 [Polymorphobacter fuscus]MQT18546.1 hypothetical protein [Polymorphobacter fuscus]NJC08331.1 hypothetical protein [Polymorphobacter fuscus]
MRLIVTLSFLSLLAASAATAQTPAPVVAGATTDKNQEIVCRKEKETGSLVKSKKTCHSRAQWAYIDDVNQNQTRTMADEMRTRSGGN